MIHTNGNPIFDFFEQGLADSVWNTIYNGFYNVISMLKNTYICFGSESFSFFSLLVCASCISAVLALFGFCGKDDFSDDDEQ